MFGMAGHGRVGQGRIGQDRVEAIVHHWCLGWEKHKKRTGISAIAFPLFT